MSGGIEHALGDQQTLCGIPRARVIAFRHYFRGQGPSSCPVCRERAEAAPNEPCTQERLHDRVLAADPGRLRDELIDALRRGAEVKMWISGPGTGIAKFCGRFDQIVEGGPQVVAAFDTAERVGLARVIGVGWQFVVVLPTNGRPLIARATLDAPPT